MRRARDAILAAGGAERSNVFTRAQLALFGQVPWRAVPVMPLEIMHLPLWFPFHLQQGVVLVAHRDRAAAGADGETAARAQSARRARARSCSARRRSRSPTGFADRIARPGDGSSRASMFVLRAAQPWFPRRGRERAVGQGGRLRHRAAERRRRAGRHLPGDRQQRDDVRHAGLSARPSAAPRSRGSAVRKLLVIEDDRAYCQPCLSPVWDTSLAGHALAEAGIDNGSPPAPG